jgi:hypothetical protein
MSVGERVDRPVVSPGQTALSPPLAGKPGLMCDILLQVLPLSVDFRITTFRSPVAKVIVSPYAKPGFTDTTATTFAGILAYAEHTFRLAALGANDRGAYDFRRAFTTRGRPRRRCVW